MIVHALLNSSFANQFQQYCGTLQATHRIEVLRGDRIANQGWTSWTIGKEHWSSSMCAKVRVVVIWNSTGARLEDA